MPYFGASLVQIQAKLKFLEVLGCHFVDEK